MDKPNHVSKISPKQNRAIAEAFDAQNTILSSSESSPSTESVAPQFINFTDSVLLDKSARTQVRVQVMRDYHRRRIQGKEKVDAGSKVDIRKLKPPSAKSQTRKFRLGEEKILRPWVPVKTRVGKGRIGPEVTEDYPENSEASMKVRSQPSKTRLDDRTQNEIANRGQPATMSFDENTTIQEYIPPQVPLDRWFTVLDVILRSSILQNSPASGFLDPFSTTALPITPRTQLLLHHYFNVRLTSAWLMMPMRKTLFSRAIHDTAMFHSFVAHYAAAYRIVFQPGDAAESTFHIAMAAKLVNQKLADPNHALTDDTIATVANLATYECSNGSAASMIVHMDGLEKMVQLRGGIFGGGFSPIVQRLIGWADFHVATALLRKPRFPPLRFADTEEPLATSPLPPQFLSEPVALSPDIRLPPSKLETLLKGVGRLSNTLKALRSRASMPQENIWYSDKIYHLQRSLFDIAHCTRRESMNVDGSLDALCSLSALIYCGRYLRDIPFSYVVTAHAVTRLKTAIEKHDGIYARVWGGSFGVGTDIEGLHGRQSRMFWVLCFGAIAAEGKIEHAWFMERVGAQARSMGIRSWTEARLVIGQVLWQDELDEAGMRLCGAAFEETDDLSAWVNW